MLAVRHYPALITPVLRAWLRPFVRYDADGRCSLWLWSGGPLQAELATVADVVAPGVVWSGILLQCYRDGRAGTPCHTDAGGTGFGFILSIGATRTFRVHRVPEGGSDCCDLDAVTIECVEGTTLLMDEAFHVSWHHQVVPDDGVTGEKLSLVFRTSPGSVAWPSSDAAKHISR